jgi:hypothetical protein
MTAEHAKKNNRIKIAEQGKLFSAILCKIMQDKKDCTKRRAQKCTRQNLLMDI